MNAYYWAVSELFESVINTASLFKVQFRSRGACIGHYLAIHNVRALLWCFHCRET